MKLQLKRIARKPGYTIGRLYIDNDYFCDTLENIVRDLSQEDKIDGHTAIPEGTYRMVVNRSFRFGRTLPRLLNVPHFEGILIHRGNAAKDTSGCILVGENKTPGRVVNSTYYEERLVEILSSQCAISIEIS